MRADFRSDLARGTGGEINLGHDVRLKWPERQGDEPVSSRFWVLRQMRRAKHANVRRGKPGIEASRHIALATAKTEGVMGP